MKIFKLHLFTLLITILFLFPLLLQAQIVDDFTDGDITANPVWSGDIGSYEIIDPLFSGDGSINADAGNDVFVLRSLQNISDAVITTESNIAYGEWIFSVADGRNWSISGTNDYKIIIISDDNNVDNLKDGSHNFNGYYIQFDGALSDRFVLYKQTGTVSTLILDTNYPMTEDDDIPIGRTIKVTRNIEGEWSIFIDIGFDIIPVTQAGESVIDNEHNESSYFGIATNIANPGNERVLYFDNLLINPLVVTATKLLFSNVPDMVTLNTDFSISVNAVDENNNLAINYDGQITLTLETGNGILNSSNGLIQNAINGEYTWTDLQYNTEDFFSISANANNLTSAVSGNIEAKNIEIYIDEDFEDANLQSWLNTDDWTASEENSITGSYSLKHNLENVNGTSYISHSLGGLSINEGITTWRFNIKNGNWNPSVSNNFLIYLMSDNFDLTNDYLNAYVVGVNLDTDDDMIKFWKITEGSSEQLINSEYLWQDGQTIGIEVIRNETGQWILSYDTNGGFDDLYEAGITEDNSFNKAYYFGTIFNYTSTRAGELWLDDIFVTGAPDENAPNIISITAQKPDSIVIFFDEILDQNTTEVISNYNVNNGIGNPQSVQLNQIGLSSVSLNFLSEFSNGEENILTICGVEDINGNQIINEHVAFTYNNITIQKITIISDKELDILFTKEPNKQTAEELTNYLINKEIGSPQSALIDNENNKLVHLIFDNNFISGEHYLVLIENIEDIYENIIIADNFDFLYFEAMVYNIVINEIMCDINPVPEALPPFEFLEIYNNTEYEIDFSGWTITIGEGSPQEFPAMNIPANAYAIICEQEAENNFSIYGITIPILNASELTISGRKIVIKNSEGIVIEEITYSKEWYDDTDKENGAWSLERIDPLNFCGENNNWTASIDFAGGTPGSQNSVNNENPDNTAPNIDTLKLVSSNYLELYFNEKINSIGINNKLNFTVNNGIGNPDSLVIDNEEQNKIGLFFETQFTDTEEYLLMIENISDNCGNLMSPTGIEFTYNLIYAKELWTEDQNVIKIIFSETVDYQTGTDINNYLADNELGTPEFVVTNSVDASIVYLRFADNFPEGEEINLNIKNIEDINGNKIKTADLKFSYYIPKNNDIVINELLFNPFPDSDDFVEIYNRSQHKINLINLQIAKRDDNNNIISHVNLSESDYYFEPDEYIAFTKGKENILNNYMSDNSDNIFEIKTFPTYSDDEGTVVILYKNDSIIDEFYYNEDMHFKLLDDPEGVSLERIDYNRPTDEQANWYSASEYYGFATPGYKNSQYRPDIEPEEEPITIEPKIFSPDGDGTDDFANIHYEFEKGGNVANVRIFDSNGMTITQLANNELLGTKGVIRWDGLYEDRVVARSGIYIIFFEVFDLDGNIKKYKKNVVLAVKM